MSESQGQDGSRFKFSYDDMSFIPTRTRKKRTKRNEKSADRDRLPPTALLERTAEELARTNWLPDTLHALRESLQKAIGSPVLPPDVLCLGLGSPASSRDSRAQLAFLLAACDDLHIPRTRVSVYDPVFTEEDLALLALLDLAALSENRMARHRLESPTVVFMPHCDLHLYDNLFRENWGRENLPHILLIANLLSEYAANIPSRRLNAEYPCVAALVPRLAGWPIPPNPTFPTAFNNTAIQYVRASALADRSSGGDVDGGDAGQGGGGVGAGDGDWWRLPLPPPTSHPSSVTASVPLPGTKSSTDLPGVRRGDGTGC